MEFRILGPLDVISEDGHVLPLGGAKQRATLAMLLLRRNEVVSSAHLIDGLWGGSPPPTVGSTLKTYVSRLRKLLTEDGRSDRLVTRPLGYRLRVEPGELDLERFESLVLRARSARSSGDVHAARETLVEALSTFTGTPLQDLTHAPFAAGEIQRLEELRLGALELRLEADLAAGLQTEVIGELETLVARFPFREVFWGDLMTALYRTGRQGDALMVFDRVGEPCPTSWGSIQVNPSKSSNDGSSSKIQRWNRSHFHRTERRGHRPRTLF